MEPSSQLRARREICTIWVNLKSPNQATSEKSMGGENHVEQIGKSGWLHINFQIECSKLGSLVGYIK